MAARPNQILTQVYLNEQEREILNGICEQEGVQGMSNALRLLIRESGRRRGLLPTPAPMTPDAQPAAQAGD